MEKRREELERKGRRIARQLGNGVEYSDLQMDRGEFRFHYFTDEKRTGTTFAAVDPEEARRKLTEVSVLHCPPFDEPLDLDSLRVLFLV